MTTLSLHEQARIQLEEDTKKFLTSGGKITTLPPETKEHYDEKNRKLDKLISPKDLPNKSLGGDAWAEEG